MSVFVTTHEHLGHTNLLAFLYLIREVNARSLSGLGRKIIDRGTKLGVRETLIVIEGQSVVTVAGNVQVGIGLARGRTDHPRNLVTAERVITLERQPGNTRLQALLNTERDEEVAGAASIIVHQIAAHPHLPEAVRLIQFGERGHVAGELSGTEASRRSKSGGLDANAFAQQILTKVVISRESHADKTVAGTQFRTIGDHFGAALLAFGGIFRSRVIDFSVEVTLPLQIVAQITSPFLKQILVYRAFLINRQKPP